MPDGEAGEVVIKGPNVMRGYLNRPEETAKTIVDGWLHTGDVGRFDEDGYLVLVDRAKDMIIRGGENIYPKEIEAVVYQLPADRRGRRRRARPTRSTARSRCCSSSLHPDATLDADAIREHLQPHRCRNTNCRWRSRSSTTCPRTPSARSTNPTLRKRAR